MLSKVLIYEKHSQILLNLKVNKSIKLREIAFDWAKLQVDQSNAIHV